LNKKKVKQPMSPADAMKACEGFLLAMAELVKASKCHNCIHKFEPKFKSGGFVANIQTGEKVLPIMDCKKLKEKITKLNTGN